VVFLGGADDTERVAEGCPYGVAGTGEGAGRTHFGEPFRFFGEIISQFWRNEFAVFLDSSRFVRVIPVSCFPEDWHGVCPL
jgi:hypothetical protein